MARNLLLEIGLVARTLPLYKLLKEKYYVDELYNMTVLPITKGIAHVLRLFEVYVVEGIAVLIGSLVKRDKCNWL